MKKYFFCVLLLASTSLLAQFPRMPVVPVDRGSPGPQLPPDPTGVYVGNAVFTYSGQTGSFTQTWTIPIRAQSCVDCEPGQYFVHSTNFDGISYQNGDVERGSVSGFVNPSGRSYLELRGINCAYITLAKYTGETLYRGGHFGDAPGSALRIGDGQISGRISGYDCPNHLVTADVSLRRQPGVEVQQCPYYGGYYTGTFANSCGGSASGQVYISQAGCAISGYSQGAKAAIDVTLTSATTATVRIHATDGCSGSATGTAQISGNIITGTYSGTSNGGFGCCPPGPFSGSFTLSR